MKTLLAAFVVLVISACPMSSFAGGDVVDGTITGISCYTSKAMCPSDKNDPHVALEHTFVLGMDKSNYYLLTNVGRQTLSPMVTQKVRVTGTVKKEFRAMYVDKIEVQEGGKWVLAWSAELEKETREKMMMSSH